MFPEEKVSHFKLSKTKYKFVSL